MRNGTHRWILGVPTWLVLLTFWLQIGCQPAAVAQHKPKLPPIYDTKADGNEQIAEALAIAKRDNKRVLLQFGANWCIWCHKLHDLFDDDPLVSKKLLYEYVLVLIDVDTADEKKHNDDVDARYGRPTKHGLPTLVVLDSDGKQLTSQPTEPWEVGDHHDPFKALAFLKKWQPRPLSAPAVLATGLARAQSESKNLFLYFSAPWCKWCGRMDDFVYTAKTAEILATAYVPLKIDIERTTGGEKLAKTYGWNADTGLPFFVVTDANGKTLVDSKGEQGNVGFPAEPHEIAHFMTVVRKTALGLTAEQMRALEGGLADRR